MDRRSFLKGLAIAPAIVLLPTIATAKQIPTNVTWTLHTFDYDTQIGLNMKVTCGEAEVHHAVRFNGSTRMWRNHENLDWFVDYAKQNLTYWYNTRRKQGRIPARFGDIPSQIVENIGPFKERYHGT